MNPNTSRHTRFLLLSGLLLLAGCSEKSDVISGLLGVEKSGDPLQQLDLSVQQVLEYGSAEGVIYGFTLSVTNNSSTDISSLTLQLDDVTGSVSVSQTSDNTWVSNLPAGDSRTTSQRWTYNGADLGTFFVVIEYGTPASRPFSLVLSAQAVTQTGDYTAEIRVGATTVDEGEPLFESLGHTVEPFFRGFYNDASYLFGFDVIASNPTGIEFPSLIYRIANIQPSSQISEFSTETRSITGLPAGESAIPSGYWCFDCNTANEERIGNFYLITTPTSVGASFAITLEVDGSYQGRSYSRSVPYTMSVQGKSPAPGAAKQSPGGEGTISRFIFEQSETIVPGKPATSAIQHTTTATEGIRPVN